MKKILIPILCALCLSFSMQLAAQTDSTKMTELQNDISDNNKKAAKLQRKVEKREKKMEKQKRKMERKEKKRDKQLKRMNRKERKLEKMREDADKTSYFYRPAKKLAV